MCVQAETVVFLEDFPCVEPEPLFQLHVGVAVPSDRRMFEEIFYKRVWDLPVLIGCKSNAFDQFTVRVIKKDPSSYAESVLHHPKPN